MLKTVSSITNAIGALNYKGTWNASTNTPALASGVGTKGDYYVVSVAGTTTLDGISNWGIGDWAVFNGSAWQRVEGGADLNGVNLSVSGTTTLSGLTASTALALDASKNVVSVTNTGTGNNVLATSPSIATPTLTGNVSMTTGNLVVGTAGKGIDYSADPSAPGMSSELLDDYEEGTWTPTLTPTTGTITIETWPGNMTYTKVGRMVHVCGDLIIQSVNLPTGTVTLGGLPFANAPGFNTLSAAAVYVYGADSGLGNFPVMMATNNNSANVTINKQSSGTATNIGEYFVAGMQLFFSITYPAA